MTNVNNKYAYISSGDGNGMYTLRTIQKEAHTAGFGPYWISRNHYVKNLSTDWKTAFEKLEAFCAENGHIPMTAFNEQFDLNEWGTCGTTGNAPYFSHARFMEWKQEIVHDGQIPLGKHRHEKLTDLDTGYRNFMRGWVKTKMDEAQNVPEQQCWKLLWIGLCQFEQEDLANAEAKEKAKAEAKANKPVSAWVGAKGQRFDIALKVVKRISYNSQFGPGTLSIMVDKDGNVLKTFGKCPANQDEFTLCTVTVKEHQTYTRANGGEEKSTVVNRMSVVG